MGELLVKELREDINANVNILHNRAFALQILNECNDLNATEPASSSGKYHPIADLGYQGLIRHARMVAELVNIMVRCHPLYDQPLDHDVMYLSGLLHDFCKYQEEDVEKKVHTNFDHPIKMANLIRIKTVEYTIENNLKGNELNSFISCWQRIALNISSHMSRWNTSKNSPNIELPLPETQEQYIIVYADLIAANPQLPELMATMKNAAINFTTGFYNWKNIRTMNMNLDLD